jgi:hypothetical protein
MALRFTEQHALSLVTPHLYPGEQVLHRARGVEKPWFSRLFFRMGAMFWKNFLVVATNQRLLLLQHKGLLSGYGLHHIEQMSWAQVQEVKLGWGIFEKVLRVKAPVVGGTRKVTLGRFWMANNFGGAEGIARQWQGAAGALGAGQTAARLPAAA